MKEYLALDFGGSSIKYAIINSKKEIVINSKLSTPKSKVDEVIECIVSIYEKYHNRVSGIGISFCGLVNPKTGYVYSGGANNYLHHQNLIELLKNKCPVDIYLENDANCAALAELNYGCLQDVNDAIVIILGTGIGGTLIHNREIIYGKNFGAGEFSILKTDGKDIGKESIWANINGISGLLKLVQKNLDSQECYSGIEIFSMANFGNLKVINAIDEFCKLLAIQIYNLQAIFDCEKIAIGGGIAQQPLFYKLLQKNLDDTFALTSNYPIVKPELTICDYYNNANLLGAVYKFINK